MSNVLCFAVCRDRLKKRRKKKQEEGNEVRVGKRRKEGREESRGRKER